MTLDLRHLEEGFKAHHRTQRGGFYGDHLRFLAVALPPHGGEV
jgi:hypothetical protein